MIVKPILAVVALKHELVNQLCLMRLLAVAVKVKEIVVIGILVILIILLLLKKRAREGHSSITTVTSEVNSSIQLCDLMTLMTVKHAG